ncbi:MAG TPA: hypothetical protein VKY82_10305 [Flavobacterium sp.]|nr:hypothetical protein [Flavobacterium sp.]
MKKLVKTVCAIFTLLCMGNQTYGQSEHQVYSGLGIGLDYGGIGAKIEYLPIKNVGVFGGLGYNFSSVGWNVGATFKIMPDKKVSINPMVFYGYNAVSIVDGAPEYEMTSYGVTAGVNVDIKMGSRGNKLSAGLFVPIRSKEFMDNYDAMKNDYRVSITNDLIPIAIGVGYNFKLN